jgi:hypothetical protein
MRQTFDTIAPAEIVKAFLAGKDGAASVPAAFWSKFGARTVKVMQGGTHLLAVLWESAWARGGGEPNVTSVDNITERRAKKIYEDPDFVPSCYINEIAGVIASRGAATRTSGDGALSRLRGNGRPPRSRRAAERRS